MAATQARSREYRLISAGHGGQGILTLGRLLCISAMSEGSQVTYLPSYGAEVRGGTANCQVVISPGTIYSPLVERADALIILNQPSYERFLPRLRPEGILAINSSGVGTEQAPPPADAKLVTLPAAEMAAEMGNMKVTNVVMLGAFVRASGIVAEQSCLAALQELFGERKADLVDLNVRAFQRGVQAAMQTAPDS